MARGKHLFPFRTEPLSPSAPMVLGSQGPGRVGRRRFLYDPACRVQAGSLRSWSVTRVRWTYDCAVTALPFPNPDLTDGLVTLRPWREGDATVVGRWGQDAEIVKWTG